MDRTPCYPDIDKEGIGIYKLLIADDEAMICSLIKRLIDWESLPVECVGVANNGEECFAMVESLRPDIIITDIRMPGLTGLELIEKCLERYEGIRFIIISGYAQFDYAQQAIKYGVSDFLIKPIQKDELNESLRRVTGSLQAGGEVSTPPPSGADLRQSLILSLTFGAFALQNYPDIQALNTAYGYRFGEGVFLPVSVYLDAPESAEAHTQTVLINLEKILRDEIAPRCIDHAFTFKQRTLHALFQFPQEAVEGALIALQYAFDRMMGAVQPYTLYHVTMGRGAPVGIAELQASFTKAICAAEGRRVLGLDALYDGSRLDIRMAEITNIAVQEPNQGLVTALQTLEIADFSEYFAQEFRRQMPDMQRYPYALGDYARAFITAFGRDVRESSGLFSLPVEQELAFLQRIEACLTEAELLEGIGGYARDVSEQMQAARPDIKIIQHVKKYIQENYRERLTLESVAKEVYLSPAYLGILFKRETGVNFSDYLVSVRLEHAKELLKDVRLNVNQVSDMVGYKDTHYFSKLFKRSVGISPVQYRKFFGGAETAAEG